jgi:hypothetical protein
MIQFGEPETWGMKVDEFVDSKNKQATLLEELTPGPLRDEYLKDFDPQQETHEEYLQRKALGERPLLMAGGGKVYQGRPGTPFEGMFGVRAIRSPKDKIPGAIKFGPERVYFKTEEQAQNFIDTFEKKPPIKKGTTPSTDPARLKKIDDFVKQYEKKYGVKPTAKKVRTELNEQRRVIPFYEEKYGELAKGVYGGQGSTKIVDDVDKLFKNKKVIDSLNSGRLPSMSEVARILNVDPTIAETRRLDLADALIDNPKYKDVAIKSIDDARKNIFNTAHAKARSLYEKRFSKMMDLDKLLPTYRTQIINKITGLIPQLKGAISVDEVGSLTASMRRGSGPYAIFGQVIDPDFNLTVKGTGIDKTKTFAQKAINELSIDDPNRVKLINEYNKKVDAFEKMANKNNPAKKVVGQKISLLPPSKTIKNKKAYNQYKDLFEDHYKKYGYSFEVGADTDTIPDILKKLDNKSFQNTVRNRFSKLVGKAGRVGALAGVAALAGTGFAVADEVEAAIPGATEVADDSMLGKGVAATGAALLTKPGRKVAKAAGSTLLKTLAYLDAPLVAAGFSGASLKQLAEDIKEGKDTEVSSLDITLPTAFTSIAAKELGLETKKKGLAKLMDTILRGGMSRTMAQRLLPALSQASVYATPAIELGIETYKSKRRLEEAKQKYGTEDMVPTAMGMAPRQYVQELESELPDIDRTGAKQGGIMRLGFANGPEDPLKRKTLKGLLALIAMAPFGLGRLAKKAGPAIEKAAPVVSKGISEAQSIFWDLYNKATSLGKIKSVGKKGDIIQEYKGTEIIEDPQTITARFETDKGNTAEVVYRKPTSEIDPETGETISIPGEFEEYQDVWVRTGDGEDFSKDVEFEIFDPIEGIKKLVKD